MNSILDFEYNHLPMYQKLREHPGWISLLAESDKRATKVREAYLELVKQDIEVVARAHKSKKSVQNVEVSVATEILMDYVGVYILTPTLSATITLEDNTLFIQRSNRSKFKATPESDSKFFADTYSHKFSFQKDNKGIVVSMTEQGKTFNQKYLKVH